MALIKRLLRILSFIAFIVLWWLLCAFIFIQWLFTGKSSLFKYPYRFFYYAMEGEFSNG